MSCSRSWKRRLAIGLFTASVLYGVMVGCLMWGEDYLIYYPAKFPEGDWEPDGLVREEVFFETENGVMLHGWFCAVPGPNVVILHSHGNAGNITHRADLARLWQQHLRASVFLYDYRGYGRSAGRPSEEGLYRDVRAAYRWLTEKKGVAATDVVLWGESIGAAVALDLALNVPHRALVLEAPFTSAVDMGRRLFPWAPVRLLMRTRFDNLAKIRRIRRPVLIIHGTNDSIVPFDMGRRLFEAAPEPRRFLAVQGADHNDLWYRGAEKLLPEIRDFLRNAAEQAYPTGSPTASEESGAKGS